MKNFYINLHQWTERKQINRYNPNYKTEVNLLRAFVNHYSFATGLISALKGRKNGSIGVNVVLNAEIYEGFKVDNPLMFFPLVEAPHHNVLEGKLCQCCDLLSWIAGTFDSNQLKKHNFKNQPTELTIENWVAKETNFHEWQLKRKIHWGDVKWLDAAHTTDGTDSMCAGIATFTGKKTVEEIKNGEIIKIPNKIKHPNLELRSVIQKNLPDPKHSSGYMG